ncbi:uncharacterized protein C8Q71DRAFT_792233 [Rhodofomes roseus]|uniref:DUF6532 domain-containing protein n=1 Tax=Rhodofomes roseus TaxID=34475 RepID=A0ABQ8JYE8_9APHY|nr:uncharacterized protein C8Q71DRAFT_792233 [Rhodofomes roseus]KAH9828977.1 hypothetical protein C8Q71DRAFT_792233 [Rhodofomes roseus]
MDIKPQSSVIQKVIHHSYAIGDCIMVFGSSYSISNAPDLDFVTSKHTVMEKAGLDAVALTALIRAAEMLGYDDDFDIADRLERGSHDDYTKPLTNYVAHRLSLFRSAVKRAVTPPVNYAYDLGRVTRGSSPSPSSGSLLQDMNYIYPWSATNGFDRRAPYENTAIQEALRAAFFTQQQYHHVGLQNSNQFKSSMEDAPSELEIPAEMLSLAMTAVESVISDHNLNLIKPTDFNATSSSAYRAHLVRLTDFRRARPKRYHRVMHSLFVAATTGHAMHPGANNGEAIDWAGIPDE